MTENKMVNIALKSAFILALVSSTALASKPVKAVDETAFGEAGGHVDFFVTGKPSMLKIHGTNDALKGNLVMKNGVLSGVFNIPMKEFVTGMTLRDEHLKNKAFEVSTYPDSLLTLDPVNTKNISGESIAFTGKLKFHGVEKNVAGQVKLLVQNKEVQHQASFTIKLTDFNIPPPEFAGMKIQDDVTIKVDGKAIQL